VTLSPVYRCVVYAAPPPPLHCYSRRWIRYGSQDLAALARGCSRPLLHCSELHRANHRPWPVNLLGFWMTSRMDNPRLRVYYFGVSAVCQPRDRSQMCCCSALGVSPLAFSIRPSPCRRTTSSEHYFHAPGSPYPSSRWFPPGRTARQISPPGA